MQALGLGDRFWCGGSGGCFWAAPERAAGHAWLLNASTVAGVAGRGSWRVRGGRTVERGCRASRWGRSEGSRASFVISRGWLLLI